MLVSDTSAASDAPKEDMKDFVDAYKTLKGLGMAAAADEVYTKQPLSFLSNCISTMNTS